MIRDNSKVKGSAMFFSFQSDGAVIDLNVVRERKTAEEALHCMGVPHWCTLNTPLFVECRNYTFQEDCCFLKLRSSAEWCFAFVYDVEYGLDDFFHLYFWNGKTGRGKHRHCPDFFFCKEGDSWHQYKKCFTYRKILFSNISCMHFVNQVSGTRAGGMSENKDVINSIDGCVQCSLMGPDKLLPEDI